MNITLRIRIYIVLVLNTFIFSVSAQELNIVHTIPSPPGIALDLAFDGDALWLGIGNQDSFIYKLSTIDGSILKTIPKNPFISPAGLTFAEGYLYITDTEAELIHKIDTTDGTFLESYASPAGYFGYPSGLAWDSTSFWLIDAAVGDLYQLDTDFQVIQTITGQIGTFGSGLTFVNGNLWFTENITDKLYEMDTTNFEILREFDITQDMFPNGLAFDGQYLWLAVAGDNNTTVDSIYQIDISLPPLVNVKEGQDLIDIKIYPNPVDDQLYLEFENKDISTNLDLVIYNVLGKPIRTQKMCKNISSIDVSDLARGTYFFILKSNARLVSANQFSVH